MDNVIVLIGTGLLCGILVMIVKGWIFDRFKQKIKAIIPEEEKKKLTELYKKGIIPAKLLRQFECEVPDEKDEHFSGQKFTSGLLKVNNGVLWAKDIASIFNLRKLIIIALIVGVIYGAGWYKGKVEAPVEFDLRGKEAIIELNEHVLKIEKDGTANVVDKDGKILKKIRVKDIPGLRQALKPYGFQLKPIAVAGLGMGSNTGTKTDKTTTGIDGLLKGKTGLEFGAGISWLKYYKWELDAFLTNKGIYPLGASYSITDNSGIGLGAGMGYEGDQRILLYYRWKF